MTSERKLGSSPTNQLIGSPACRGERGINIVFAAQHSCHLNCSSQVVIQLEQTVAIPVRSNDGNLFFRTLLLLRSW